MKIFKNQKGFGLLLVIILLSSMMTITLLVGKFTLSTIISNRETRFSGQSLFTASSGMERALFALYRFGETNFEESGNLYEGNNSKFSYTLSSEDEGIIVKAKGVSSGTERDLESKLDVTQTSTHLEIENLSFFSQDPETFCRGKTFYIPPIFPNEELWRVEQEDKDYGDCIVGQTTEGFIEFGIPQELSPLTQYYISFRALYTNNPSENISITPNASHVSTLESNETLFPIPFDTYHFFTCAFREPFEFLSSDTSMTLSTSSPVILDWISFSPSPLTGFAPCEG